MKQSTENRLKRAKELEELKKLRAERIASGGQAPELDNLKHNKIMCKVLYYPLRLMRKVNKIELTTDKKVREDKKRQSIDSGMVNDYIKEISGEDFTSKDFRTWSGTVKAFLAFKEHGCAETETEKKKVIAFAIDKVATQLGNTRTVCRKYYIHPEILSQYESGAIQKYFDQLDAIEEDDNKAELTKEEKIVLSILEKVV